MTTFCYIINTISNNSVTHALDITWRLRRGQTVGTFRAGNGLEGDKVR